MIKTNIRKGDTIVVISGKDKGKTGKVISILTGKGRVIVTGINYVKKHEKPSRRNEKGGIVEKESSINLSNIMLLCSKCNKGVRIKKSLLNDGKEVRRCVKCGEEIGGKL